MSSARPIPDSYTVDFQQLSFQKAMPGRLLGGEYPGAKSSAEAEAKLGKFLDAGVNHFLDLTEAGEYGLKAYAPIAAELAGERGAVIVYQRMSIKDVSVPSEKLMIKILNSIDKAVEKGSRVYVHCYGGIGRTGTVIGCWLVRHGLTGNQAIAKIGAWRRDTPDGWRESPETDAQRQMVREWQPGR